MANISVENAHIIYRNFAGREGRYNKAGVRSFCVVLPEDRAEQLRDEGWNIRIRAPKEAGDEAMYYLPVAVRFDYYPPKIYMISSLNGMRTVCDEDNVGELDEAELSNVDLIIRPRYYERDDGTTGIKAYLKIMYATLEEDEFAYKYVQNESVPFA